ncbi:MAG TPA: glycosyltransferase [Balneolales bacterium]|nr:glycosyltransferase [Balneolales bacterium]
MHVLVIPSWYKSRDNPVNGSFFEEQARGLQKNGLQVGVLCPLFIPFHSKGAYSFEKYVDQDLPTYVVTIKGIVPRSISINYWYIRKKGFEAFINYVESYGKPDLLHAHTAYFGGIVAEYISRKTGIPYVLTEHYSPFIKGEITNKRKLNSAVNAIKNAKLSIVVSNSFRNDLSKKLGLQTEIFKVIPNLVNSTFFQENRLNSIDCDGHVVFFSNSFLRPIKNHKLIIDAFKIFVQSWPNATLIIGGDGLLGEDLRAYTEENNLSEKVVFTGLLSREEVRKKLNECHIFLSSSLYETFSVVLIEAMAVGRPVITTDSGGPRDFVNEDNGSIVKSWDAVDYAQEMLNMVNKYNSFNQVKISDYCRNRFSENVIIDQLLKVYEGISDS